MTLCPVDPAYGPSMTTSVARVVTSPAGHGAPTLETPEVIAWLVACPVAQWIVSCVRPPGVDWKPSTIAEPCWWQPLTASVATTTVVTTALPTRREQTLVPPVAAELGPAVETRAPPARMTNDPVMAATVRTRKHRLCKGMAFPFRDRSRYDCVPPMRISDIPFAQRHWHFRVCTGPVSRRSHHGFTALMWTGRRRSSEVAYGNPKAYTLPFADPT
jgi:hypothetical protein